MRVHNLETVHTFNGPWIDLNKPGAEAAAVRSMPELASRHPNFFSDIRAMSQRAGLSEVPLIGFSQDNNAAATKVDGKNAMVIGKELLSKVNSQQLNGVIGHELAHLVLNHPKTPKPPSIGSMNGIIMDSGFMKGLMVVPVIAGTIRSQRHEFAADKLGARITGDHKGQASFLREHAQREVPGKGLLARLMNMGSTHPLPSQRVKRLNKIAGDTLTEGMGRVNMSLTGKSNTSQSVTPIRGVNANKNMVPQMPKGIQKLFKRGPAVPAGAGPKAAVAPKAGAAPKQKAGVSMARAPKAPGMKG